MTTFIVTYTHPDEGGWQTHLDAHLRWLLAESEGGRLRLSGPLVGTPMRSAMLIIEVADRPELDAVIATDRSGSRASSQT